MHPSLPLCTLAVVGLLAACQPASAPPPGSPPRATSATDYDAVFRARTDSARRRFTPADAQFMTGMIGHHAQALVMAAHAPANDASATIRTLAARITNAQRDEIALMQGWLRDRGQAVPAVSALGQPAVPQAMGHDMSSEQSHDLSHDMTGVGRMPGMLTDAQLARLAAARGDAFDRLFLTFMIQHHRGAVVMVNALFGTDGAGQDEMVFKFASDVQVDQSTEIARMERLLATLPSR